jgi:hypothetical protein
MSMMDTKVVEKYKNNMTKKLDNNKGAPRFGGDKSIQIQYQYQHKNQY